MTDATLNELEPLIHEAMAEWQIPGLAIAVVRRDEPLVVKGFGHRGGRLDHQPEPASTGHVAAAQTIICGGSRAGSAGPAPRLGAQQASVWRPRAEQSFTLITA